MFSKTKIALSAAIVLSTAVSASAATAHRPAHVHRSAIYNMVPGYNSQTYSNSNDPRSTGGGSLGYNQLLLNRRVYRNRAVSLVFRRKFALGIGMNMDGLSLARTAALPILSGETGVTQYPEQIRRFPMLEPQEEFMLAKRWREHGDLDAAHKLVTSHFVSSPRSPWDIAATACRSRK